MTSTNTNNININIDNTIAFVTGTNKKNGIGRAIVDALLQRGAKKVYATARDTSQLQDLVISANGRVVPVTLDVTNRDAIKQLGSLYPDVNLVVNNAGYAEMSSSLDDNAVEAATKEMEINYIAPLGIVKSFANNLRGVDNSAVVNIASIASFVNFPIGATYSASKAATHSLTQAQRRDVGDKTLVVGVYPGPIDTSMAEGLPFEKTAPSAVADRVMDALSGGEEDVFPDKMAVELHEGWQSDAKSVERMMAMSQAQEQTVSA